jgi:hypothetical protein
MQALVRRHGLGFPLAFHPEFVLGQGTKITMEHDSVVDTDRDKPGEREQCWAAALFERAPLGNR